MLWFKAAWNEVLVQISAGIGHISTLMLFILPSSTLITLTVKNNKTEHNKTNKPKKSLKGNNPGFRPYHLQRKDLGPTPYQLLLAWSSGKLMLVSQYLQKLLHSISKEKKNRL